MTRYRWITARKAEGFPVRLCCRVLQMAAASYYDWLLVHGAGATSRELDEAYLVNEILSIHGTLDDSYGSPRLTHELRRERWPFPQIPDTLFMRLGTDAERIVVPTRSATCC